MNQNRLPILTAAVATALGLVATAGSIPSTPEIERKRGEAAAVLEQIREIDPSLDQIVDRWNGRNVRLEQTRQRLARSEQRLRLARTTASEAQQRLADRVVALYTDGQPDTLEVILGAESFDDLLDRTETARHISDEDARIAGQANTARRTLTRRATQMRSERGAEPWSRSGCLNPRAPRTRVHMMFLMMRRMRRDHRGTGRADADTR